MERQGQREVAKNNKENEEISKLKNLVEKMGIRKETDIGKVKEFVARKRNCSLSKERQLLRSRMAKGR